MQKTYIFGHKKPDSDSVMSAIGLSYLKNLLGENTEPRILGDINKETAYALKYFHLPIPEYLIDVKLQLKDIDYHKNFYIKETDSIYTGYQKMLEKLREHCEREKMSIYALAKNTNLSTSRLSNLLNGKTKPLPTWKSEKELAPMEKRLERFSWIFCLLNDRAISP